MSSDEIIEERIRLLAESHKVPIPTLRILLGEFLAVLHETEFKAQALPTLYQVYFSLGPEAAWHFFGLACKILDSENSQFVADVQAVWNETAMRLDGRMMRFCGVLDRWKEELEYDLQQDALDKEDTKKRKL